MDAPSIAALASRAVRRATSPIRTRPTFIIIGGIRCGTTSLISYLADHPATGVFPRDEIHYFDWNYDRGENWYRAFFPIGSRSGSTVAGESSPSYLMDPAVPPRVAKTQPNIKLILLLRNPVDRAHSHYALRHGKGMDKAPTFEAALEAEEQRLAENAAAGGRRASNLNCYFHHGRYVEGLGRWLEHFDRSNLLIMRSDDLYRHPAASYRRVLEFVGLPVHDLGHYNALNAARYDPIDPGTRAALAERYAPHNAALYELIGEDLGWI